MKKRFLLLPLVAILAACNKGAANNDIFTNARKMKISASTKQGVQDRYDRAEMTSEFSFEQVEQVKENGEWVNNGYPSGYSIYFRTVIGLERDNPYLRFETMISEGEYSADYIINNQNGVPYFEKESEVSYIDDAKQLFKVNYNSFFSWNASFFAGCTYFLSFPTQYTRSVMPQQILNKYANKKYHEIVLDEESAGTFYINQRENFDNPVSLGSMSYNIVELLTTYENYLLASSLARFEMYIPIDKTHRERVYYSFNTPTVNYYDAL